MNRLLLTATFAALLTGCVSEHDANDPDDVTVCQGVGCQHTPGKPYETLQTHKPTKDEKIRARQGNNPDFGSDDVSVRGSLHY